MMNTRSAWWLVLFSILTSAAVADDSSDRRFLAGLRERGLFELAETYCVGRLQRKDLSDADRADLVIERSRSLAEWAVSSPPQQRGPLWGRASKVTEDFARDYPQSPRLLLVRLQQALGHLAQGELARQEAPLTAEPAGLLDEARTHLRVAIKQLGDLSAEVERRLRERNLAGRDEPGELGAHQLASLQENLRYQLARALRNQAECYGTNSPDRANSLTRAVKLLGPLSGLDVAHPLAWKSRIDLIVSYRLLADFDAARRQLEALSALKPPPPVELRARAQRIHLALATGRLADAIAVLSQGSEIDGTTSPELDYAWLEAYLAAGRAAADAGQSAKAAAWQARATDVVERIEQLYGPYWTRRAGMLLARYVRGPSASGDLAMLVRAAESSFRSGRFDDALAAYDRAQTLAAKQGNAEKAFDLGYIAATIEHQRRRHDQALDRYRQISMAMPAHPKAPEAHLLAIYHAAQIVKGRPKGPLDQYAALLQEHLRTWPKGPGAERVWRQLGQLREHQHQWQRAIQAYQAISPGNPEYLQAAEAVERCYRAWLSELEAAGKPSEEIATQAADWFESLVLGPQGRPPERWSPLQRFAVLAAARLRLDFPSARDGNAPPNGRTAGYAKAAKLLSTALQGATDAPPDDLLGMLECLGRVAAAAQPEVRTQLAELQVRKIKLLLDGGAALSRAERQTLARIHAQALADTGRTEEALRAYRVLAEAYPRDGAIQEAYARLLSARDDQASLKVALAKWRELEKNSPPRSPRWFRAKYAVASLHYRQGNKQQAAKIIKLLQVLHPELGGPEMKRRFGELLKSCQE